MYLLHIFKKSSQFIEFFLNEFLKKSFSVCTKNLFSLVKHVTLIFYREKILLKVFMYTNEILHSVPLNFSFEKFSSNYQNHPQYLVDNSPYKSPYAYYMKQV